MAVTMDASHEDDVSLAERFEFPDGDILDLCDQLWVM